MAALTPNLCSPINMLNDMFIWYDAAYFDKMTQSYRDFQNGVIDRYDCGITSAPCNSNATKELVSAEPGFVYWFDLLVVFVGLTVLSVVGIVGNTINIIIIATTNIANDTTNNLYLWLSVSDLLTALNCGALVAVCLLCYIDDTLALSAFSISFPYLFGNINKISLLSLDFVAVISVQRAVAIVYPFKISAIFTNRNTNIVITVLFLLTIATNMPLYAAQRPRFIYHPYFNKVISLGSTFLLGFDGTIQYLCAMFYTRSAINVVVISVSVPLTIYKLHVQGKTRSQLKATPSMSQNQTKSSAPENKKKNKSSSRESTKSTSSSSTKKSAREVKVIKMSVTVCVITFVIFCFNIVIQAILQIYAHKQYDAVWATNNGGLALCALGASFNFFLYLTMSLQYRDRFSQLFRMCRTPSP